MAKGRTGRRQKQQKLIVICSAIKIHVRYKLAYIFDDLWIFDLSEKLFNIDYKEDINQ